VASVQSRLETYMQASEKKKIAVYYPAFLGGGAETVALWILEALKEKYDLTLFTISNVDFERLNSMYGTHLSHQSIIVKPLLPKPLALFSNSSISNSSHLRMILFHFLMRYMKAHQEEYDLTMSAYNAADLGQKGIHYVHWIKVLEGQPFYEWISDFSKERMKSNVLVTNSQVVAGYVKQEYGCDSVVVYPPVVLDTQEISWEQKDNAFICSGRLTEAKQPHKVIQILERVRNQGFDIKLHITGGGGGAYAWKYHRFVKKMVAERSSWVTLYENLKYADYVKILAKCKYGIHFKEEPFGISIAEMVKAGAISFVRSKGGQVEIVGRQNEALFFNNEKEAVEKIVAVLSSSETQKKLIEVLQEQKNLFSTERFMREMLNVVDNYFAHPSVVV